MVGTAKSRRKKFVPLFGPGVNSGPDSITVPGRVECTCLASRHPLVANCLSCGRIVCSQEGAGPCFTCGLPVGTEAEEPAAANDRRRAAVERRNRLLERDGGGGADQPGACKVIDDQADYFHTGSVWLNGQQRKALSEYQDRLRQKRHDRSTATTTFTLDFERGCVDVQSDRQDVIVDPSEVAALLHSFRLADSSTSSPDVDSQTSSSLQRQRQHPSYVSSTPTAAVAASRGGAKAKAPLPIIRVQDGALSRMSDDGLCLSVRQPWASLLVSGHQQYEGRTWYTEHRGRLWIAAARHAPSPEDLAPWTSLGLSYQQGCLLGCVTVEDCLPQEEFQQLSVEESGTSAAAAVAAAGVELVCDAPYVIVCSQPRQLAVKFPVQGGHKIFQLDRQIHRAAQKMLSVA